MDNNNDENVFLNLIVQKVYIDQIQTFMKAWLRQESKDFRLVFIQDDSTSKEEKLAIKYAVRFSEALGIESKIAVVNSVDDAPKAKMTKILKDTSVFFEDKLEILKLKTRNSKETIGQTAAKMIDTNAVKTSSSNIKEKIEAPKAQSRSDEDVTIAMATHPCRVDAYVDVVYQLLSQCTRMCICFNGFDEIPKNLPKSEKIIAICANGKNGNPPDLGCNNKMYWLGDFPGYYATVDDDIIYPPNYIQTIKDALDKCDRKAIVSFHGHIYKPVNGKINIRDKQLLWFKLNHPTKYCHRLGMGVAMSYPSKLNLSKDVFLKHPKNTGDDELMALWAQRNHVPMICLSTNNISILSNDKFALTNCLSSKNNTINKRRRLLESFTNWKIYELDIKNGLAISNKPCESICNIVYIFNDTYVIPTIVSIFSLIKSNSRNFLNFYLISSTNLPENVVSLLQSFSSNQVKIQIIYEINNEKIKQYSTCNSGATNDALLKFEICNILPQIDKCLYLDGDTLIKNDIGLLYFIDINNYYAAVIKDSGAIYSKTLYVNTVKSYFNSGVMLLNLKMLREKKISDRLFEKKKEINAKDQTLMDQPAFNYVFDNHIKLCDVKWNTLITNLMRANILSKCSINDLNVFYGASYKSFKDLFNSSVIIHYASKQKPWNTNCELYNTYMLPWKKIHNSIPWNAFNICIKN